MGGQVFYAYGGNGMTRMYFWLQVEKFCFRGDIFVLRASCMRFATPWLNYHAWQKALEIILL